MTHPVEKAGEHKPAGAAEMGCYCGDSQDEPSVPCGGRDALAGTVCLAGPVPR